jgi:hypothetical protein
MICLTSFHNDHWDIYARNFISSWIKYWPTNCKLIIYHQEWDTEIDDPRIIKIDIDKEIPDVVKFRERTLEKVKLLEDSLPVNADKKEIKQMQRAKDKYLKGIRWSHKVYATCDALVKYDDTVIWLDSDTDTISPIPKNWDEILLRDYDCAVHIENQRDLTHWETGLFVLKNIKDKRELLVKKMLEVYNEDKLWDFPTIWDGHIWPVMCDHMQCRDLNKIPWKSGMGTFCGPDVKSRMRHHAGKKKFQSFKNINSRSGRPFIGRPYIDSKK